MKLSGMFITLPSINQSVMAEEYHTLIGQPGSHAQTGTVVPSAPPAVIIRGRKKITERKILLLLLEELLGIKNATYPLKGLLLNRAMETEFSKETGNRNDFRIRIQTEVKRQILEDDIYKG